MENTKQVKQLTDEDFIAINNDIYEHNLIWFILGSLISSDNFYDVTENMSEEVYSELFAHYENNINILNTIARTIDRCDRIPESEQKKIKEYAENGAKLLTDELEKQKEIIKNK